MILRMNRGMRRNHGCRSIHVNHPWEIRAVIRAVKSFPLVIPWRNVQLSRLFPSNFMALPKPVMFIYSPTPDQLIEADINSCTLNTLKPNRRRQTNAAFFYRSKAPPSFLALEFEIDQLDHEGNIVRKIVF